MSNNIETKKILYENASKGVKSQIERKKEIDAKTFNMLSVVLIILGLVIEFIDVSKIINTEVTLNIFNIFICLIMLILYIAIIVLSIIVIIKYILILQGKKYRTIDPNMYIDVNENKKSEDEILRVFLEELVECENNNSKINEEQMKKYNCSGIIVIIVVIMSIVLNLVFNIFLSVQY